MPTAACAMAARIESYSMPEWASTSVRSPQSAVRSPVWEASLLSGTCRSSGVCPPVVPGAGSVGETGVQREFGLMDACVRTDTSS